MSLSATLFGTDSLIFKATNILGLGIPGLLHKTFGPQDPEAQVSRLGDISRQTAKEGDPRVIVWGRVRPIGGNIIHCQSPVRRWVVTSTTTSGKGGGKKKQEQRTEHVYRTYAIGVCEGPITAFSRIWRNNKLVYDGRGTAWGARNNGVFLRSFRLYLGGWAQMPDPTLQSIWGGGNVPAYRGTAYMVSIDEDLTDQGGMVPQWQFEVERAEGVYLTSKPYAAESMESLSVTPAIDSMVYREAVHDTNSRESLDLTGGWVDELVFRSPTFEKDIGEESLDISGAAIESLDWSLWNPFVDIEIDREELDLNGATVESLDFREAVVNYEYPGPDSIDITGAAVEGLNWYEP